MPRSLPSGCHPARKRHPIGPCREFDRPAAQWNHDPHAERRPDSKTSGMRPVYTPDRAPPPRSVQKLSLVKCACHSRHGEWPTQEDMGCPVQALLGREGELSGHPPARETCLPNLSPKNAFRMGHPISRFLFHFLPCSGWMPQTGLLRRQLPQHVKQDPTVLVVLDLSGSNERRTARNPRAEMPFTNWPPACIPAPPARPSSAVRGRD